MKNALKEKFKHNILVAPLYRKIKNRNKIKPRRLIIDNTIELDGHDISIKRDIVNHSGNVLRCKNINKRKIIFLCNACESYNKVHIEEKRKEDTHGLKGRKMLGASENIKPHSEVIVENKTNKLVQADNNIVIHKVPHSWLRLYPLPKLPDETMSSVIIRCLLCQLGLATVLVLWTFVWIFVVHHFEGPNEIKVSLDFENAQNQLVIDLATELRQITPLSPRWRAAIEQRIEEARQRTSAAIMRGAKPRPGQYWDLSGSFLFAVYVMTALGFGAPVPQTIGGRISAMIYAIIAVPTHIYLMLNLSMYIVVNIKAYIKQLKTRLRDKRPIVVWKTALGNETPNCSRYSEVLKAPNKVDVGRKIMRIFIVVGSCNSLPLIGLLYYVTGACIFGVQNSVGSIMFPLEFTTSGDLELIPGHIRIMYGFYVEGAMTLFACALATMRTNSKTKINRFTEKYRLFAYTK